MNDSCLGISIPAPAGFSEPSRSRVAVAACASYSSSEVEKALAEILESLGGLSTFVRAGQTVLIKPNLFSTHPPEHAVTTHPELVRQMVLSCIKAGAGPCLGR